MRITRKLVVGSLLLMAVLALTACGRGSDTDVEVAVALTQTAVALEQPVTKQPEATPTVTVSDDVDVKSPSGELTSASTNGLPTPLFYIDAATDQVLRLEADGVTQTVLTDEDSAVSDFDISPDGRRLAYVVNNQLVELDLSTWTKVVKVEGETIASDNIQDRLERRIHALHYSPDGSTIAFGLGGVNLIDSGESQDIYPLLPSSPYPQVGTPVKADADGPIRFFWPRGWSPDGNKLLIEFAYYPEAGGLAIYDLTSNQLFDFTGDDPNIVICCEAAWSPDSSRLYLASNLLVFGNPGLTAVDADTGAATVMIEGLPGESNSDFHFFRAPLGTEDGALVFLNRTADLSQMLSYTLTGVSADGVTQMARQNGNLTLEGEATWVDNGSGIAYLSDLTIQGERNTGQITWWPVGGTPVELPSAGHMLRFAADDSEADLPLAIVDEGLIAPAQDERSAELSAFVAEQWEIEEEATAGTPAIDGVFSFPLHSASSTAPLWVSHTTGIRDFETDQTHAVGIFTPEGETWQEVARLQLGEADDPVKADPVPDFLSDDSVTQVFIEPSHLWLSVEGGAGAHSGIFNLLSYDGETLRTEASGFSASPGVAGFDDLNGNGNQEVILDATDYYVFCYACGVRLVQYDLLRWNGTRLEGVTLQPLSANASPALAEINERALNLADVGLWKDALSEIEEGRALNLDDPIFEWNSLLIELNAAAKREVAESTEGYPILDNIFYGDYNTAVDVMRDVPPTDIFSADSPLIIGTTAEGSTELLADWITRTTTSALTMMPDLAPAHFLRGWAAYLETEDVEMALPFVAQAAAIEQNEPFYQKSIAYLLGDTDTDGVTSAPAADAGSPPAATPTVSNTLRARTLVNVRSGPSTAAQVLGELTENDLVQVLGRNGNGANLWWQIVFPAEGETQGWVNGAPALVAVNAPDVPVVEGEESLEPVSVDVSSARLFFSAQNEDGNDAIFQLLDDGTAIEIVTKAKQPAIQPGGDRLAFYSTRDDMLGLGGYDLAGDERLRFAFNIEDGLPTWNPAVQRIIFASTRYGDGRSRLYGVWGDGQGDAIDLGYGQDPDWHPSEDLIVFKGCDASGAQCGLWTMNSDGTGRRRLTDKANDARPVWTPDGNAVIFMSSDRDKNWELYRLDMDGLAVTRLTNNPANDGLPAVSPDGRQVMFMSNRDDVWSLQTIPVAGGPAQTLYVIGDDVADWLSQGIAWER